MGRIVFYLFGLLLSRPLQVAAQPDSSTVKIFKETRSNFLRDLKAVSNDSVIINPLARYVESQVNEIYEVLVSGPALPVIQQEKAVRSLVYFMTGLGRNMKQNKSDIYDIPGALQSYRSLVAALVYHKPFIPILTSLAPRRTQLLASAFSQYEEYPFLDDIVVYKRVAAKPEFIWQFLENKPGFRFADSLQLISAAHDPVKFASYLTKDNGALREKVPLAKSEYLQQILSAYGDKNAEELLPFVMQLAENRITPGEIFEKRMEVVQYFQLLVNTLMQSRASKDSSSIFLQPLREGLRQKALAFFVTPINELHNAADATRFASVKDLRPEDLYYIITSCGEELYTSSYLGLYKRLKQHFNPQSADSIFTVVGYDNFPIFMRLAANYNVAADFFRDLSQEQTSDLLKRFTGRIEQDPNSGLEKAMDIADFFSGLDSATAIRDLVHIELQTNYKRCIADRQFLGIRLYNILLQVMDLVSHPDQPNKLWQTLGNYEVLKRKALESKSGEILQSVLFYGDADGVTSFNNFLKLYADKKKWEVIKTPNWVSIRSLSDQSMSIYANMPLDSKEEMDLRAQDSLYIFLQQQGLEPSVLIHRGHSYHLDHTLKRLNPSVKLAILGSCGGYNKGISIASISPDVQVIGSKKMGAKSINDPMIDIINETLLTNNDLVWSDIWRKLSVKFSKDQNTLSIFSEYFPPAKNVSLFVLKLFVFYN